MTWTLVTGGTGTIGSELVRRLLREGRYVRVFSRDEGKQVEFQECLEREGFDIEQYRFFVGDIRDRGRLARAMGGVEVVYHLAALKHVTSCEYNPTEAVKTNIRGVRNVVDCAAEAGVKVLVNASSDKAAEPNNLMGATKLVGERLVTQANGYGGGCRFASLRFGNVLGSRGSVLPRWEASAREKGEIVVTDPNMTRFIMGVSLAVDLVLWATDCAGGEIFVRDMPSVQLGTLAAVWASRWEREHNLEYGALERRTVGSRAGETLHEKLITEEEAPRAVKMRGHFAILPNIAFATLDYSRYSGLEKLARPYSSDRGPLMSEKTLRETLEEWGC